MRPASAAFVARASSPWLAAFLNKERRQAESRYWSPGGSSCNFVTARHCDADRSTNYTVLEPRHGSNNRWMNVTFADGRVEALTLDRVGEALNPPNTSSVGKKFGGFNLDPLWNP